MCRRSQNFPMKHRDPRFVQTLIRLIRNSHKLPNSKPEYPRNEFFKYKRETESSVYLINTTTEWATLYAGRRDVIRERSCVHCRPVHCPGGGRVRSFRQCWGSVTFLVRIRTPGSVPLTNGSGSDPDPTPFFSDFKDAKNKITYQQAKNTLSSVLKV